MTRCATLPLPPLSCGTGCTCGGKEAHPCACDEGCVAAQGGPPVVVPTSKLPASKM